MKRRSLIALLLAVVMCLSLFAGCGGSSGSVAETPADKARPTTNGKAENSLTIANSEEIASLDPQHFTMQSEDFILVQIYEPLFIENNDGTLQNILVEDYTVSEDGTTAEITLKSGVTFQSGDPFTAEDVAYTLARSANATIGSELTALTTIEVIDDTHFVWSFPGSEMGAGFYEFVPYIASMRIANKSFCEGIVGDDVNADTGLQCDGTGAYSFVEKAANGDVTLKRYEGYHGEASIDTIRVVMNTGSEEIAFESGDIDYAMYSASGYKKLADFTNVNAYAQSINNIVMSICNCVPGGSLENRDLREAVALTLNKNDIMIVGTQDSGTVANVLGTPLVTYYDDNAADHFDTDIERANELLSAHGYTKDNPMPIEIVCLGAYPDWIAACEVMKENMEQANFAVTITELADQSRYFTNDFDLAVIGIGLTTAYNSYAVLFDDDAGMNLCGIQGEEADAIRAAFAAIKDEETTHAAMKTVTESLAYIPLFCMTTYLAFDGDLNCGEFYVSNGSLLFREFSWNA